MSKAQNLGLPMQSCRVRVECTDSLHARASVRNFELRLGARRADPEAGLNPVETLLSALGDCLLTALDFVPEQVCALLLISLENLGILEDKDKALNNTVTRRILVAFKIGYDGHAH